MISSIESTSIKIIESKMDKLKKAIFFENNKEVYYCVAFYDKTECVICVSSQIGCPESCKFCATANQKFVRNLSKEEIKDELIIGLKLIKELTSNITKDKQLSIIFEGMGEASYNLDHCFSAFREMFDTFNNDFKNIVVRVSSVGNVELYKKYLNLIDADIHIKNHVKFEVKLSLHTPFDEERLMLTPNISSRYSLDTILETFYKLSDKLETKLICNYVLFNYPDGGNNYSANHLTRLSQIINPEKTKIILSSYSDTKTGFMQAKKEEYFNFFYHLNFKCNIETQLQELLGSDVNAACGMLHYQV